MCGPRIVPRTAPMHACRPARPAAGDCDGGACGGPPASARSRSTAFAVAAGNAGLTRRRPGATDRRVGHPHGARRVAHGGCAARSGRRGRAGAVGPGRREPRHPGVVRLPFVCRFRPHARRRPGRSGGSGGPGDAGLHVQRVAGGPGARHAPHAGARMQGHHASCLPCEGRIPSAGQPPCLAPPHARPAHVPAMESAMAAPPARPASLCSERWSDTRRMSARGRWQSSRSCVQS